MSTTLHLADADRLAAQHLLSTDFGTRLHQIDDVTITDDGTCLSIRFQPDLVFRLSSGEQVLMGVLASLAASGSGFNLRDLHRLSDDAWDAVIAALFIARGRILHPMEATA